MTSLIATVSNFALAVSNDKRGELNYQINLRMKQLYREGCRRFRFVPMPKTGDADRFLVMGWPN